MSFSTQIKVYHRGQTYRCHKIQTIHTSDFTSRCHWRSIHLFPSCLVASVRDPHVKILASFLNFTCWFKWVKLQPFASVEPCHPKDFCIFSQSRYLSSAMLWCLNFLFEMLKRKKSSVFLISDFLFFSSLKFLWFSLCGFYQSVSNEPCRSDARLVHWGLQLLAPDCS